MKSKLSLTIIFLLFSALSTYAQPVPPEYPFNHPVPINDFMMIVLIFGMIILVKKDKEK